jgi:hypothetical protein
MKKDKKEVTKLLLKYLMNWYFTVTTYDMYNMPIF